MYLLRLQAVCMYKVSEYSEDNPVALLNLLAAVETPVKCAALASAKEGKLVNL